MCFLQIHFYFLSGIFGEEGAEEGFEQKWSLAGICYFIFKIKQKGKKMIIVVTINILFLDNNKNTYNIVSYQISNGSVSHPRLVVNYSSNKSLS